MNKKDFRLGFSWGLMIGAIYGSLVLGSFGCVKHSEAPADPVQVTATAAVQVVEDEIAVPPPEAPVEDPETWGPCQMINRGVRAEATQIPNTGIAMTASNYTEMPALNVVVRVTLWLNGAQIQTTDVYIGTINPGRYGQALFAIEVPEYDMMLAGLHHCNE